MNFYPIFNGYLRVTFDKKLKKMSKTLTKYQSHLSKNKVAFRRTKKQQNLSQIHVFFDKTSFTKIKTRKGFKKGSENSQVCHGKPTNTPQIQFLID